LRNRREKWGTREFGKDHCQKQTAFREPLLKIFGRPEALQIALADSQVEDLREVAAAD